MSRVKNQNFIVVHGWMLNVLNLEKLELLVFAIIYGFSQAEGNKFTGSLSYICEWVGGCKTTISKILNELVEKEYIIKHDILENNIKYCHYEYNRNLIDRMILTHQENMLGIPENAIRYTKNCYTGIPENAMGIPDPNTYNKIINNNKNKNKNKNTLHEVEQSGELSNLKKENTKDITFSKNNLKRDTDTREIMTSKNTTNLEPPELVTVTGNINCKKVDNILKIKLSDVDPTETKTNRLNKEMKESNKLSTKEKVNIRNKKNRIKEAKEIIDNLDVINALEEFLDFYQFTYNIMSPQTWNKLLKELVSFSNDPNILISSINNSICNSWRSFYNPLSKRTKDKEPSYMIKKTNFYPEDRIHETVDRALGDDGTVITF